MKHLPIARLFIVLGTGALLADIAPGGCGTAARTETTPAVAALALPGTTTVALVR